MQPSVENPGDCASRDGPEKAGLSCVGRGGGHLGPRPEGLDAEEDAVRRAKVLDDGVEAGGARQQLREPKGRSQGVHQIPNPEAEGRTASGQGPREHQHLSWPRSDDQEQSGGEVAEQRWEVEHGGRRDLAETLRLSGGVRRLSLVV